MKIGTSGLSLLAPITCVLALAGCSDPKKPSNENFKKSIQAALDVQPACINLPGKEFPLEIAERNLRFDSTRTKQLDALVKAGLLTSTSAKFMDNPGWGQPKEVEGLRFDYTPEGKKVAEASAEAGKENAPPRLCYGKKKVTEVVRYTEPSDAFGMTASQVVYKQEVVDVAAWAKSPEFQQAWPVVAKQLNNTDNETDLVVLTSEGWVHESMMKK